MHWQYNSLSPALTLLELATRPLDKQDGHSTIGARLNDLTSRYSQPNEPHTLSSRLSTNAEKKVIDEMTMLAESTLRLNLL